ncbi:MAG: CGGC domain-containing protein, partial [Ignavibacteriae bacterium]|nr:CGGC domain-containing protein [Ignavibacteriota bacterium]
YINSFKNTIKVKYGADVIVGTHPIPQKYFNIHKELNTWGSPEWEDLIKPTLADEKTRLAYD